MFDWLTKKKPPAPGPDYSKVDSREKAERLASAGELAKLYLLPPAFGGDDSPPNMVYVPSFVVDIKHGIDTNTVMPLVSEGKITKYSASPTYQGSSFVPNAIEIRATEPANFEAVIRIWGDALNKEVPHEV